MDDSQYDAVMIVFSPNYQEDIGGGVPIDSILEKTSDSTKAVVAVLNSPVCTPPTGKDRLERGRVPVFSNPERAALALSNVLNLSHSKAQLLREVIEFWENPNYAVELRRQQELNEAI